jgi:hypothetical protein
MLTETEQAEYLAEIRDKVCSRCVERPAGGPPCAPLGKNCGVETHLPQLIEAIHEVHSTFLEPYLEHDRHVICEKCAFLHSSICPCPMDYLAALIVDAVETVDERRAEEDEVPYLLAEMNGSLADVQQAYKAGHGTWTGCDWPTRLGKSGVNLEGWRAAKAEYMVEKTRGTPDETTWKAAARWLTLVEHEATLAERQALAAVTAAEAGDWQRALQFAELAWAREFGTGRAIWHSFPLAWQKLLQTVQAAFLARQAVPK